MSHIWRMQAVVEKVVVLGSRWLGSSAVGRPKDAGSVIRAVVNSLNFDNSRCQQDALNCVCTGDGRNGPRACDSVHPHGPVPGRVTLVQKQS